MLGYVRDDGSKTEDLFKHYMAAHSELASQKIKAHPDWRPFGAPAHLRELQGVDLIRELKGEGDDALTHTGGPASAAARISIR